MMLRTVATALVSAWVFCATSAARAEVCTAKREHSGEISILCPDSLPATLNLSWTLCQDDSPVCKAVGSTRPLYCRAHPDQTSATCVVREPLVNEAAGACFMKIHYAGQVIETFNLCAAPGKPPEDEKISCKVTGYAESGSIELACSGFRQLPLLWGYEKRRVSRDLFCESIDVANRRASGCLLGGEKGLLRVPPESCKIFVGDASLERDVGVEVCKKYKVEERWNATKPIETAFGWRSAAHPELGASVRFGSLKEDLDLGMMRTFDTGSKDQDEVRVFEGTQTSFDFKVFSIDAVLLDYSAKRRYARRYLGNGAQDAILFVPKESEEGRMIFQKLGFIETEDQVDGAKKSLGTRIGTSEWSRLLPRGMGATLGMGVAPHTTVNTDEDATLLTLKYGAFAELTNFLGIEGGRITAVALSGSFKDRTDSAWYWGIRITKTSDALKFLGKGAKQLYKTTFQGSPDEAGPGGDESLK